MNQPKSVQEQIEQNSRQIKHAVFFAVILACTVLVVGVYFVVIGHNARKAEQEKQTQQRQDQILKDLEERERDFKERWGSP